MLRREAPRERCPGGREDARSAVCFTSQLRIGAWNCGRLSNVTMTMCKDLGFDILALSETQKKEARNRTIDVVMKERDRRWSWLGHVLRMPEHRLVRQFLFNCVRPTHETLFADVPNLSIDNATKLSKDRKLWSSNRPSLRCQPL